MLPTPVLPLGETVELTKVNEAGDDASRVVELYPVEDAGLSLIPRGVLRVVLPWLRVEVGPDDVTGGVKLCCCDTVVVSLDTREVDGATELEGV